MIVQIDFHFIQFQNHSNKVIFVFEEKKAPWKLNSHMYKDEKCLLIHSRCFTHVQHNLDSIWENNSYHLIVSPFFHSVSFFFVFLSLFSSLSLYYLFNLMFYFLYFIYLILHLVVCLTMARQCWWRWWRRWWWWY